MLGEGRVGNVSFSGLLSKRLSSDMIEVLT